MPKLCDNSISRFVQSGMESTFTGNHYLRLAQHKICNAMTGIGSKIIFTFSYTTVQQSIAVQKFKTFALKICHM